MVGAVGQMIFMLVGLISARVDAHPCPVSPKPWRKMRVAVCLPEAEITTGEEEEAMLDEEGEEEEEDDEKALENFSPINGRGTREFLEQKKKGQIEMIPKNIDINIMLPYH